jgi:NADH dehydrogenase
VRVQITLGDLADPVAIKQAVRGVDRVVHLGAAIRDQPGGSIEELNAMATIRLLREAEAAGVERFLFFSAIGATASSPTRFFRAKAIAEKAVLASDTSSFVLAPSLVYAPGDPWFTLLHSMTRLPWMPISGSGRARFQPIWVEDVADCAAAVIAGSTNSGQRRFELAGPDVVTYDDIVRLALEGDGRRRPLVHVPLGFVRHGLRALERVLGPSTFATWEEAQLLEESMTSARGAEDVRSLGVEPRSLRDVLGLASQASV